MRELIIRKNDAGQRLDKFLTKAVPSMPQSLLYKSIRLKKIKVNRKRTEASYILCEGDSILLFLSEDLFPDETGNVNPYARVRPNLSIVYEDEQILLLNKKPGVLVHADEEGNENTLIFHVQAYLYQKGEYDPSEEQSFAPALCNRIDRNTGGIVIAAKTAEALRDMNELIRQNDVSKYYICAVHGLMPKKEDTLKGFLKKDEKNNLVSVSDREFPGSKPIETRYQVLSQKNGDSLLKIELVTGRTHQIRAHMAHIGHPLLGDGKYGVNRDDREQGYKYQALYAFRLFFHTSYRAGNTCLDHLRGRTFEIPREEIWFEKDFR